MSLTRTAARTRIRTLLYEPTAKSITDAEINSWIDDACHDISLKTLCCQVYGTACATVNGTNKYVTPSAFNSTAVDTIAVKTVVNSNSISLDYISPQLLGRVPGSSTTMTWTEWGNYIVFSPIPTAAYTYYPLFWIAMNCTAAGTIGLPAAYHHLIPLYGHYKGMQKKRDWDGAANVFKQYTLEMQSINESITYRYRIVDPLLSMKDQVPQE